MMPRPGQHGYQQQQQQQQQQGSNGGPPPHVPVAGLPTVPSSSVPPQQVMLQVKQLLVLKLADLPQAAGEWGKLHVYVWVSGFRVGSGSRPLAPVFCSMVGCSAPIP
jgi:hypothetical protein